jgi:hypothetical protein
MKVAAGTLRKMEVAAGPRAVRRQRWQFSILAILALTSVCSVALVAIKPYWPVIRETLWPVSQELTGTPVEFLQTSADPCPWCGQG